MRRITVYRDDATTPVIYDNVKHIFWTAGNTVLVIAQYTKKNAPRSGCGHRYVQWLRERVCWFKDENLDA